MAESNLTSGASGSQAVPDPIDQDDNGQDDANLKKANVRKRTKTGCLTCRKRRIKCDEGRPICSNCIKSKRQCEGYNQRVIFKNPMGTNHGGPYGPLIYPPHASQIMGQLQTKSSSQGPLPVIAPKPPGLGYQTHENMPYGQYGGHAQPTFNFNQHPLASTSYSQQNMLSESQASSAYVDINHTLSHPQPLSAYSNHSVEDGNGTYSNMGPSRVMEITDEQELETQTHVQSWEYPIPDDDASMEDSEDESRHVQQTIGPIMRNFSAVWDQNGTRLRAFSSFAHCDILSEYTASAQITELKDPRMLAIFMHFIKVTGPSMSLYERHPFDLSEDQFEARPTKNSNLWSYTFPIVSFNHPGLLHAILALAALQIAKLQKMPPTAALKHYHLALRRIGKNVRSPLRRTQPPTLAAALLLAYFEVWSSDHSKWCNHLFGAQILIRELNLKEMSRKCLPMKRIRQQQKDARERAQNSEFFLGYNAVLRDELFDLDYTILSALSGKYITEDDYRLSKDEPLDEGAAANITDRDIDRYENLRDLFWWYCKMDVYQSFLGGTKLFMEFDDWTVCPPRGAMSKLEAIYGTYDHMILLLGRLAKFSSKDLSRKRRASRSQGVQPGPDSPPAFPGILPTHGKVQPPMGFSPPRDSSPQSDSQEDDDPEASYQAALEEWEAIREGFQVFINALGPEFQPLRPEFSDNRECPFGRTLQYRTFSVAGIWMNYYMGMIHLHRTHPSMPPAAMQAVGLSARSTAEYATQIGLIAAGLHEDCSNETEISTLVSAAFIESCFCLFVAAVQYRDDAQRHWMVRRMHDIARLTGWQSAKRIADGCESGWIKAAQLGRGPPYVRVLNLGAMAPSSVWQNPRRIDRKISELDPREENRLVLAKSERASYALGLIGVEHDLEVLELKDEG